MINVTIGQANACASCTISSNSDIEEQATRASRGGGRAPACVPCSRETYPRSTGRRVGMRPPMTPAAAVSADPTHAA